MRVLNFFFWFSFQYVYSFSRDVITAILWPPRLLLSVFLFIYKDIRRNVREQNERGL